ncbi:MAG TPA: cobalamin-binding protein [Pyrinomonadaceae bacterium]|nr:cobalamin-binding protein [Pyrinomonadaceae bacterium]
MFNDLAGYPRRIICLTEETTETIYLLGEGERIVGISGYTVRPPEARQKPKVSAFINAKFDKIMSLEPDLVFAFSDLQADIAAELIRRGVTVFTFNQRGVNEILEMILTVGRVIGCENKANKLVETMQSELSAIAESAKNFPFRPRVYFEEWFDPLISGIRWVEELIEIAGGEPTFPELRKFQGAKDRIIDSQKVIDANPQVIIGSWCGKALKKKLVLSRDGWENIEAVKNRHIYEVKSAYILQPGPAALTEGIRQLHKILAKVAGIEVPENLNPLEKTDSDLLKNYAQK